MCPPALLSSGRTHVCEIHTEHMFVEFRSNAFCEARAGAFCEVRAGAFCEVRADARVGPYITYFLRLLTSVAFYLADSVVGIA